MERLEANYHLQHLNGEPVPEIHIGIREDQHSAEIAALCNCSTEPYPVLQIGALTIFPSRTHLEKLHAVIGEYLENGQAK